MAHQPTPDEGGPPPEQPQPALETPLDDQVRQSAWRWIRMAAIMVTIYVGYQLLLIVGGILGVVATTVFYGFFGIVVALVTQPAVNALERRLHLRRTAAALLVLFGAVVVLCLLIYAIATPLANEARSFVNNDLPRVVRAVNADLGALQSQLQQHGINANISTLPANSANGVFKSLGTILISGVAGVIFGIVDAVIVLVVAFWVLRDGEELRAGFINLLPGRLRSEANFAFDAFSAVIGGYVRAQLALALILGVLAGAGCYFIGVPSPLVVAVAVMAFELIPIVGPFLGGAVALLLAATVGLVTVLLTLGLFILIHIIEAYVLSPRIQARFVRLHPVLALLALLAGIEAGGFIGAFLAVPAASLLAVFVRALLGDWKAQRPELFAIEVHDMKTEGRRRRLLREFRILRRH